MEQNKAPRVVRGKYYVYEKLGKGSFAAVYRVVEMPSQQVYAMKVMTIESIPPAQLEAVEKEIDILYDLNHHNIVKIYDNWRSKNHIYLILEFCAGGDLSRFIKNRKGVPIEESFAIPLVRQLASGLTFVWSRNVVHRDLKPGNLLLTEPASTEPGGPLTLKIADFGLARYIESGRLAETVCGSPLYMAPEVLERKQYDYRVDLWAVGAILFELVTGKPPFQASSERELLHMTRQRVQYPSTMSAECQDLINGLLQRNPKDRLSIEAFLHHPFLEPPGMTASQAARATQPLPTFTPPVPITQLHHPVHITPGSSLGDAFVPGTSPNRSPTEDSEGDSLRAPKTPSVNPFKSSSSSKITSVPRVRNQTDSSRSLTPPYADSLHGMPSPSPPSSAMTYSATLSMQGVRSPLFTLADFAGGPGPEVDELKRCFPSAEVWFRYALLICELADVKGTGEGADPLQALTLAVKGLNLTRTNATRIMEGSEGLSAGARALASDLLGYLEDRCQTLTIKAGLWIVTIRQQQQSGEADPIVEKCAEQLVYEHAVALGKDAATDELMFNDKQAYRRFDVATTLLDFVMQTRSPNDSDRHVMQTFIEHFRKRKYEAGKRLVSTLPGTQQ